MPARRKGAARRAPRGLTQAAYARRRGVSRQAVNQAVRERRIPTIADGRIDPAIADRQWRDNTDQRKPRNSVTGNPGGGAPAPGAGEANGNGGLTLHKANAIRALYSAKLARLEFEEKQGRLIGVDVVKARIFRMNRRARNKLRELIVTLPLEVTRDPAELLRVRGLVTRAVDRICAELSDGSAAPAPADDVELDDEDLAE